MKKQYLILSGEGEKGTWSCTNTITPVGLKRKLTAEQCNGDRWAKAFEYSHVTLKNECIFIDEKGEYRIFSLDELDALGFEIYSICFN